MVKKAVVFWFSAVLLASFAINIWATKPTVNISASPATIIVGGSSTMTWTSSNSMTASIDNGIGTVPLSGSLQVSPSTTTKYTITVTNSKQSASASVTVTLSTETTKVGITSFVATPASVPIGIPTLVTLSWTTVNATSVTIDNNVGSVPLNGSVSVNPTQTTTYILTAKGRGGSVTANATVTFRPPQPPSVSFTANPVTIQSGDNSTLSWNVSNADSIYIDNGIGAVAASGSMVVSPLENTIYTLTASNIEGTTNASSGIYLGSGRPCYAYVPDADYDSQVGTKSYIKIIDTATNSIVKTFNVDNEPKGILIGTGGTCVYFSSTETNKINKIDPITLQISGSLGGVEGGPQEMVLHTSGNHIYAIGKYSATLSVVDDTGSSMVLRKILTIPAIANGLAVHPDGSRLYVSISSLNQILVLDTAKLNEPLDGIINKPLDEELIDTISVNGPWQIQFNLDGSRLFICQNSDLVVMDVSTQGIIHTYPNLGPRKVRLNPAGDKMYLLSYSYKYYVINLETFAISEGYKNSYFNFNENISFHPDGSRIYSVEASYFHIFDAEINTDVGYIYFPSPHFSQA